MFSHAKNDRGFLAANANINQETEAFLSLFPFAAIKRGVVRIGPRGQLQPMQALIGSKMNRLETYAHQCRLAFSHCCDG
jgi:hypothetical protein